MRNQFLNNPNTEILAKSLADVLLGERIPLDVWNSLTGEIVIMANRKITLGALRRMASLEVQANKTLEGGFETDPSPIRNKLREIVSNHKWI